MFVLDDDGSLVALVHLISQHEPLLGHRLTGLRVDLVRAGLKPFREKDVSKKYDLMKMISCTEL